MVLRNVNNLSSGQSSSIVVLTPLYSNYGYASSISWIRLRLDERRSAKHMPSQYPVTFVTA